MENQSNININNSSKLYMLDLHLLLQILRQRKNVDGLHKNQVIMIYILGLYFPPYSCYDVDFILQFGADKKKVSMF